VRVAAATRHVGETGVGAPVARPEPDGARRGEKIFQQKNTFGAALHPKVKQPAERRGFVFTSSYYRFFDVVAVVVPTGGATHVSPVHVPTHDSCATFFERSAFSFVARSSASDVLAMSVASEEFSNESSTLCWYDMYDTTQSTTIIHERIPASINGHHGSRGSGADCSGIAILKHKRSPYEPRLCRICG
jgi:hypothetical protein